MSIFRFGVVAMILAATLNAQAQADSAAMSMRSFNWTRFFDESDTAEIYVARNNLETPAGFDPSTLIDLGCRYLIRKNMPAWTLLENGMRNAPLHPTHTVATGETRVGLVLRSRVRTVLEVYSASPRSADARVTGYIQGDRVQISAVFARILQDVAARYPELAMVDRATPELCAR
jgi:hypothetical protein